MSFRIISNQLTLTLTLNILRLQWMNMENINIREENEFDPKLKLMAPIEAWNFFLSSIKEVSDIKEEIIERAEAVKSVLASVSRTCTRTHWPCQGLRIVLSQKFFFFSHHSTYSSIQATTSDSGSLLLLTITRLVAWSRICWWLSPELASSQPASS